MGKRYFDLNMPRRLKCWAVAEAFREILGNAVKEEAPKGTTVPRDATDARPWNCA